MNKIIEIKFGSHLYGTNTENSDTDYKGIYLPTAKEICLNSYKKTICTIRPKQVGERNTKDDTDVEFFSLDQFMKLLCEGQTIALDMLFSPEFCKGFDITFRKLYTGIAFSSDIEELLIWIRSTIYIYIYILINTEF